MGFLVLLLLAVGALVAWPPESELTYEGKSASQWFRSIQITPSGTTGDKEAVKAFRAMGDPGVKFVARQFSRLNPLPIDKAIRWLKRVPGLQGLLTTNQERILRSLNLLFYLGPNTKAAIPELLSVVANHRHPLRHEALALLDTLPRDSERAVPVLVRSLQDQEIREWVAGCLIRYGRAGLAAAPALREMLQAPRIQERATAAVALIGMREYQEETLATAREIAKNGNASDRQYLIHLFGKLTENYSVAVPFLVQALQDEATRDLARPILRRFDPEAAAKAGI